MSKEETMVERLTLIIARHADAFASQSGKPSTSERLAAFSELEQAVSRAAALAVIDALMEPSDDLLEAGGNPHSHG